MFTLLICAAHNNRSPVVEYLLEILDNSEVDSIDSDGQTALYHAALGGHTAVLKRLMEAQANPNTTNKVMFQKKMFRKTRTSKGHDYLLLTWF